MQTQRAMRNKRFAEIARVERMRGIELAFAVPLGVDLVHAPVPSSGGLLGCMMRHISSCERKQHIVRIKQHHHFAAAGLKPRIDRRGLSAVGLEDGLDVIFKAVDDFRGMIRRTIIHHDDFHLVMILRKRTFNRLTEIRGVVVIVDDDADLHEHVRLRAASAMRSCVIIRV